MKHPLPIFTFSTRTIFVLATALLGFAGAAAAEPDVLGSGHVISETRAVSGFHGVEIKNSGDVIVTQGDTEGLVIEADDNVLPLIDSTVGADSLLHLGFKDHTHNVKTRKPIIFRLAAKTMDKVVVAGSGDLRAASLSADHFHVEVPGSGDVAVDHLQTGAVKVDINGSGDVKLAGEARNAKVSINGTGDYEARSLKTDDVTVGINGTGDAEVWANTSLAAEINGTGDVAYAGSPKVTKSVHGTGEVAPLSGKKD